jgi:2-polyprenyl-6-methoxyphenol hydroxylase-like FAD-dependent oxidoreductase
LSGRGTSQALLGAYVLAGELSAQDSHESAFAEYERSLRDYVASNQKAVRMTLAAPARTQEMLDDRAAASTGENSADNIALKDYPLP